MKNLGNPLGNYKWFIGQVPPNQNQYSKNSTWNDAHNNRVKVRIPSMHPMSGKDSTLLKDDDLPWAIVAQPTSHGNFNMTSSGIWGGEWVIGFFLDEEYQIPVITHVLSNNLTQCDLKESVNGTTQGKRICRYNSGLKAGPHQTKGVPSFTKEPAQPTKQEFEKAKETTPPEREVGSVYTDEFGNTYEVIRKNKIEGSFNPDGTNKTFNVARKLN